MAPGAFATLLVLAIANWRISTMLSDDRESGPWNVLYKIRARAGVEYDSTSTAYSNNQLGQMILCIKCVSLWVGVAMMFGFIISPEVTMVLSLPFFLSGVSVALNDR